MQPELVVGVVEVAGNRTASVGVVGVVSETNLVVLKRSHEPLADGIVRWRTGTAHTDLDCVRSQDRNVLVRAVRAAAVGVMDQTCRGPATPQSHLQGLDGGGRSKRGRDRPADAPSTVRIQDDGNEDERAEE